MQSDKRQFEVTMISVISLLEQFHKDEGGQGLVEYILVVGLICLAVAAALPAVATKIASGFATVGNKVTNAVGT